MAYTGWFTCLRCAKKCGPVNKVQFMCDNCKTATNQEFVERQIVHAITEGR